MMTRVDSDLVAMMERVLSDARSGRSPLRGSSIVLDTELWAELAALGLTRLTAAPQAGGSGASWGEGAALLATAARHAVHLPIAESDLLAGWLLQRAGLPCDNAIRTACVLDGQGVAHAVPWARYASSVAVLWFSPAGWRVADVAAADLQVTPQDGLAGESRDTVSAVIHDLTGTPVEGDTAELLRLRGALARSVQVCGAMERILELCISHVTTRHQFGRSLSRFQAVQSLVVDMAAEVSLARVATDAAVSQLVNDPGGISGLRLAVAVARSCTGHASSVVVRNAHQVHGAIGTTLEHELHKYTFPVLAWRSEYGSIAEWDAVLSSLAVAAGAEVWELVAGS